MLFGDVFSFPYEIALGLSIIGLVFFLCVSEIVHISVIALIIPVLAVIFGVFDVREALVSFSNPVIFLFLGGFALSAAIRKYSLNLLLLAYFLRFGKYKLSFVLLIAFCMTFFFSMLMNNTTVSIIMVPTLLALLKDIPPRENKSTYSFALLGIAYSANIGGMATLIGSPPNAIVSVLYSISFMEWMSIGFPVACILWPVSLIVLFFLLRPNLQHSFSLENISAPYSKYSLLTCVFLLLSVLCWIFGDFVQSLIGRIQYYDTLVSLFLLIALCVCRVLSWQEVEQNTQWGILIFFGGGLCLSNLLYQTGTASVLSDFLLSLIHSVGTMYGIVSLLVFTIILTTFISNTVSTTILTTILSVMQQSLAVPVSVVSVFVAIASSCTFILPISTPVNLLVFSSGFVKQSVMIRTGLRVTGVCIVFLVLFVFLFVF